MKKIRITEADVHKMVMDSVKRVLSEVKSTYGHVGNDGNGMVGGSYGSYETEGECCFPWEDVVDELEQDGLIPEGSADMVYKCLSQHENDFILTATFKDSWDESTNYSDRTVTPNEEDLKHVCDIINTLDCPVLGKEAKEYMIWRFTDFFKDEGEQYDTYEWKEDDDEPDYEEY